MTSLSEQLLRLALPDGSLGRTHGTSRPSLLFDSKEAVLFDKDTIYGLGLNGFEELCKLNSKLHEQFFDQLFSEKAKDLERTMKSKEYNKNLDKTIDKFLLSISQYFLLRPAQKCVEWLVYRFHIHSYNVGGFLKCILPYHASNLFARAVQIIQPQEQSVKWSWLKNIQEDNTGLSMKNIVLLCNSHSSFFHLVCDMMQSSIRVAVSDASSVRLHVKFFASAILGMIHYSKRISDDTLTRIMPLLNKSFALKEENFQAAVLMIVCQLSATVSLETDAVLSMIDHCLEHCLPQLQTELFQTVVLICETQDQLTFIPTRVVDQLYKAATFFETLQHLVSKQSADNFLQLMIKCSEKQEKGILLELLKNVELPVKAQELVIRLVMQSLFSDANQTNDESLRIGGEVLKFMQQRYAEVFDSTVSRQFDVGETSNDMLTSVLQTNECSTIATLTIGLLHPSFTIRIHSLKALSQRLLNSESDSSDLQDFAKNSIVRLLKLETEDSVLVECLKVLQSNANIFANDLNGVGQLLIDIVLSQRFKSEALCKVLLLLTSETFCGKLQHVEESNNEDINLKVFCLVLKVFVESTNSTKWKKQAKALTKSHFVKLNKLFNIKETSDSEEFLTKLLNALGQLKPEILQSIFLYTLDTPNLVGDESLCFSPFAWFLMQACCSPGSRSIEVCLESFEKILECVRKELSFQLKSSQVQKLDQEAAITLLSRMIKHESDSCVLNFLFVILNQIVAVMDDIKSPSDKWNNIRLNIFVTLTQVSSSIRRKSISGGLQRSVGQNLADIFRSFFQLMFDGASELMQFLTNLLVNDNDELQENHIKLQVLHLLPVLLSTTANNSGIKDVVESTALVPVLILCCTSMEERIRSAAINCIKVLADIHSSYKDLASFLHSNSDEIKTDSQHLAECLKKYFVPEHTVRGKVPSDVRKKRSALLSNIVEKHVIGTTDNIQINDFGLAWLNKCLPEISTVKMFDNLNDASSKLLLQKADTELTEKDHKFLTVVVHKAATCEISSQKLLSLFSKTLKPLDENANCSTQCATLRHINKKLFFRLNETEKNQLLDLVLQLKSTSQSVEVTSKVNRVLKIIPLHADHVIEKLKKCRENLAGDSVEPAKRRKLQTESVNSEKYGQTFMLAILETLQQKKQIVQPHKILAPLCTLLNDYVIDKLTDPSEYMAQLIIGCLHNLVKRSKAGSRDEVPIAEIQKSLQLDPVVYFIQQTENSLVHREAILLLAESVEFFPDKIVHTIMSIFTFMGSSLLRRDDSYSFQVISQTIQSVVPALMTLKGSKESQQQNAVEQILQVFVDALPHIPAHRRLTVLKELLNAVGPSEYTWQTMVLLLGQRFTKINTDKAQLSSQHGETQTAFSMEETVEICQAMTQLFSVDLQIKIVSNILKFAFELPNEFDKETPGIVTFKDLRKLMNIDKLSLAQLCNFRLGTLALISHLLSLSNPISQAFNEIKDESEESIVTITTRMEAFECLLLTALQLDQQVTVMKQQASVVNKSEKYYDALCGKTGEILDKINQLLPTGTMLLIVSRLLEIHSHQVHLKVIHIFTKHISYGFKLSETEVTLFEKVAKHLVDLVTSRSDGNTITSSHYVAVAAALTRIVKVCGMECSSYFVGLVPTLCGQISKKGIEIEVLSAFLECLGALIVTLKAHCIVHLPIICSCVSKLLSTKAILQQASALHAVVKTVLALFQSVANFLSPYLVDLLSKLSPLALIHKQTSSAKPEVVNVQKKRLKSSNKHGEDAALQLHTALQSVLNIIAKKTAPRLLIPAFASCYEKVADKCPLATLCLLEVANTHLKSLNKKVLSIHSAQFFSFYMETLDFRSTQNQLSLDEISKTEDHALDGIINLFLKLPEEEFQILYHKLFLWGCSPESTASKSTTFYRCINILASKLKSLFTALAVDLLPHIAKMFDGSDEGETKDSQRFIAEYKLRMSNAMEALTTLLQADDSFVNQERFDLICQPLVEEMQKVVMAKDDSYDVYVKKYVVPLIGELASCSNNNVAWQPLHNQILMKMRHNSKKVRMFALDTVLLIAEKLGHDYMSIVPDTVPFLAELMEDDDAEVEKHCHVITTKLEGVLGESLQKFF